MFAAARVAAGRGRDELPGATVAEVLSSARARYGEAFGHVLATCRVWVNGEPADEQAPVGEHDEIAVLPPVSGGAADHGPSPDERTVEQIRARREELQGLDDAVSYVRRVAQGRADVARDALRRAGGATDVGSGLREVLADRLLGGGDRPPRPAEDFSDHPLCAELDELCGRNGFGRLDELSVDELHVLVDALDRFERQVSDQRREVFGELDAITDELVERYRLAQDRPGDDEDRD